MIRSADYKFISDSLGLAKSDGFYMASALIDMRNDLRDNELSVVDLDKQYLDKAITDTYRIIVNSHLNINIEMRRLVSSLQNHVRRHYADVNDFLNEKNIKVSQDFADLSSLCGFEIDPENIE